MLVEFPLLNRHGEVSLKTGLNWGYSDGHVCLEAAYLPLKTDTILNTPGFFNPISNDNRIYIACDNGEEMLYLLEARQSNLIHNQQHAKQISSDGDKSIIGHYIRSRLGFFGRIRITTAGLLTYGRTSISVSKIGYSTYEFNFSQ